MKPNTAPPRKIRGTTRALVESARLLRRDLTPAERVLWDALQGRQLAGLRFRHQHAIGPFVAVGSGAIIGARTIVHPGAVIGREARVGDDCVVHAHVSIRDRVTLGNRVIVQNGACIGRDGDLHLRL